MNRSWFGKLATLVIGLAAVVAITTSNLGCSSCRKCGAGCDKPCCKKVEKVEVKKEVEVKKP